MRWMLNRTIGFEDDLRISVGKQKHQQDGFGGALIPKTKIGFRVAEALSDKGWLRYYQSPLHSINECSHIGMSPSNWQGEK